MIAFLRRPQEDPALAMELVQNVRPPAVREQFNGEVARLLHNYAASSATLVDHSRRLVSGYPESDFGTEYEQRKDVVAASPEVNFVKGLRNYMLHRRLPAAGHSVRFTNSDDGSPTGFEAEVRLSVAQLRTWDGWPAPARQLLSDPDGSLPLVPLLTKHGAIVTGLASWMLQQFEGLHREDIDGANALIAQRNAILMGGAARQRPVEVQLDPTQARPHQVVPSSGEFRS
jgi:hypothetical protein